MLKTIHLEFSGISLGILWLVLVVCKVTVQSGWVTGENSNRKSIYYIMLILKNIQIWLVCTISIHSDTLVK